MRAWLMDSYEGIEKLRIGDVAGPQPGAGQVLLRMKVAALNPADAFLAKGLYPAKPPLPGATYGSFAAACHYVDGTFTPQRRESKCGKTSPDSGAAFSFWHPDLVTMHLWLWYPNPDGVFNGTNPLIAPFNR